MKVQMETDFQMVQSLWQDRQGQRAEGIQLLRSMQVLFQKFSNHLSFLEP